MPATGFYKRGTSPSAPFGPSLGIWADCPILAMIEDPSLGWHRMENWNDRTHSYSSNTAANGYLTYQDTGVTIAGANLTETELNSGSYRGLIGYLQIAGADADNDEGNIQAGNGTSNLFCFDSGRGPAWFETIVRFQDIADISIFVGLCDQAAAAADFMTDDTGAIAADEDLIGFRTLVASPTELDAIYQTASGTLLEVNDNCATLAASTTTGWVLLGITFSGTTITYFVNGLNVGTADSETAGFPDGVAMAPFWALKASAAEQKIMDIGWWRAAQLYEAST